MVLVDEEPLQSTVHGVVMFCLSAVQLAVYSLRHFWVE